MTDHPTAPPVAVELADGDLAAEVTAHVESHLGWQVVHPGPHLPVWLRIADAVDAAVPTVVVAWQPTGETTRELLRAGALDVLAWPGDAGRLRCLRPAPRPAPRPAGHLIGVAGAAAGVGASTVALALGAILAWGGHRTVVITDDAGRRLAGMPGGGAVEGVAGLSVVPDTRCLTGADAAQFLVADLGVARRGQVLVGRPDHHLVGALSDLDPIAVVTTGVGGLRPDQLARVVRDRCHVTSEVCFRVARAGFSGRVPVGLPGRWVAALQPVVTALVAPRTSTAAAA